MSNFDWRMQEVWNASMEKPREREDKERTHLWASELLKAPADIWHTFKRTEATNPPNGRSILKFKTGDMFEWWMGMVLRHAGILQKTQEYIKFQVESGLLEVSGRADFIAGGKPNLESARKFAETVEMPMFMVDVVENLVGMLTEKYPDGLGEKPIELKSCSSFLMNRLELDGAQPLQSHKLQLMHYIMGGGHYEGLLTYVCRDDLRMKEFTIYNTAENRQEYIDAVRAQTNAINNIECPDKEPLLIFELGKCTINYNVAYSKYLTLLYGFKQQMEYEEIYRPKAAKYNRVLKRIASGAKLTAKNELIMVEMRADGFDPTELAASFAGESSEEEE